MQTPLLKVSLKYYIQLRFVNGDGSLFKLGNFVFVNIGMFAVLSDPEKVYVGELCNPILTWNIDSYDNENNNFKINDTFDDFQNDPKNILNLL
jgi:hypothetical protein